MLNYGLKDKVVLITGTNIGTSQDIADTVLFLASDKASWLTGLVIKVSGDTPYKH